MLVLGTIKKDIHLISNNKPIGTLFIEGKINNKGALVNYSDNIDNKTYSISEYSFFEALSVIREKYTKNNIQILCKGCTIDVYPGGLLSDETFGEFAYEIDSKSLEKKVVNIFDPITIENKKLISSILEQENQRMDILTKNKMRL